MTKFEITESDYEDLAMASNSLYSSGLTPEEIEEILKGFRQLEETKKEKEWSISPQISTSRIRTY